MRTLLTLFAVLAVAAAPAAAQTNAPSQPAPAEKPKTVTKVVCDRIIPEGETGSRLNTPKVCRKVEVPVKEEAKKGSQPQGNPSQAY